MAVKRIRKLHYELAKREVDILIQTKHDDNIVEYFFMVNLALFNLMNIINLMPFFKAECLKYIIGNG